MHGQWYFLKGRHHPGSIPLKTIKTGRALVPAASGRWQSQSFEKPGQAGGFKPKPGQQITTQMIVVRYLKSVTVALARKVHNPMPEKMNAAKMATHAAPKDVTAMSPLYEIRRRTMVVKLFRENP